MGQNRANTGLMKQEMQWEIIPAPSIELNQRTDSLPMTMEVTPIEEITDMNIIQIEEATAIEIEPYEIPEVVLLVGKKTLIYGFAIGVVFLSVHVVVLVIWAAYTILWLTLQIVAFGLVAVGVASVLAMLVNNVSYEMNRIPPLEPTERSSNATYNKSGRVGKNNVQINANHSTVNVNIKSK